MRDDEDVFEDDLRREEQNFNERKISLILKWLIKGVMVMQKILAMMTICIIISSCGLKGKLYLEEKDQVIKSQLNCTSHDLI